MRISDWSSDVCSSDLRDDAQGQGHEIEGEQIADHDTDARPQPGEFAGRLQQAGGEDFRDDGDGEIQIGHGGLRERCRSVGAGLRFFNRWRTLSPSPRSPASPRCRSSRSEEHTSELQSLMRISYAVLCLKKKTNITKLSR